MIIKKYTLGPIEDNNYLLIDETSKEAILIDCTEFSDEIFNDIKKYNANLKYILLTHAHFDHVLGVNDFKKIFPNAKVILHNDDKQLMDGIKEFCAQFGLGNAEIQKVDKYIFDNEILSFGENEIKIIHTPGHTKGSVCFLIGDKIFTGDTLFYESVGRTDLPGGSFQQIQSSIKEKLFTLDDKLQVLPGHGISSTIKHEKNNNKFN